jgi:hypothetical protein
LTDAHKHYVAAIADRLAFAGPLLDAQTSQTSGSLIVAEFADLEAVKAWLNGEPFSRGGVYATTDIREFVNRWARRVGFPSATA